MSETVFPRLKTMCFDQEQNPWQSVGYSKTLNPHDYFLLKKNKLNVKIKHKEFLSLWECSKSNLDPQEALKKSLMKHVSSNFLGFVTL